METDSYSSNDIEEVDSGCTVSPGGHKYYVPYTDDDENLNPCLNKSFAGIAFFKEYARLCGFDIRRSAEKKHDDGTIISKYWFVVGLVIVKIIVVLREVQLGWVRGGGLCLVGVDVMRNLF